MQLHGGCPCAAAKKSAEVATRGRGAQGGAVRGRVALHEGGRCKGSGSSCRSSTALEGVLQQLRVEEARRVHERRDAAAELAATPQRGHRPPPPHGKAAKAAEAAEATEVEAAEAAMRDEP